MKKTEKEGCAPWIPARYILAVLGFSGITLQYIMKANMSVAIVAMVSSKHENKTGIADDTCPLDENNTASMDNDEGEFDWSISQQGHLLSSYYYGYVCTQLLGGYLSQRFGGRFVMGPGVAITGLLTLLTTVVARKSFLGLCILRALEGAASGVVIPSMQSLFTRWYPLNERHRISGFIFSSIQFGSLAGLGISGLLADWGGWPAVFYVTGSAGVLWFVIWILLAYDSPQKHPRISSKERDYIIEGLGKDSSKAPKRVPWLRIITSPPIWASIAMHIGVAWVLYTILNELPTYLNNILHYDVRDSGVISSLPYLFGWISGSVNGALSQWVRSKGYLSHLGAYRVFNGIVAVGVSLCFLTIILVGCNSTVIVAMFVLALFFNGFIYGGSYINHVDLSPNHAGTISGIIHTIINTPGFVTPAVTSALLNDQQTKSNWNKVFYVTISIVCGVYLFYLVFGSVTERSWNSYGVEDENEPEKKDSSHVINISSLSSDLKAENGS